MSESEEILVEEEVEETENGSEKPSATDEFVVKGEELLETVKKLAREAGVRRIVVRNKSGKTLIEIPIVLGVAGIALLPAWSALALIAALVTECSILVEKSEKQPEETAADNHQGGAVYWLRHPPPSGSPGVEELSSSGGC